MTLYIGIQSPDVTAQVGNREQTAERLIKTLRELPNKEALALRSEVAVQVGRNALHSPVYSSQCRCDTWIDMVYSLCAHSMRGTDLEHDAEALVLTSDDMVL